MNHPGLFWQKYGDVTIQEFRHARSAGKPCFVYIRDKGLRREPELENFLQKEVYDLEKGITYDFFDGPVALCKQIAEDVMAWLIRLHRELTAEIKAANVSAEEISRLQLEVDRLRAASRQALPKGNSLRLSCLSTSRLVPDP